MFWEIMMMIFFGLSWPFSIITTLKAKDLSAKSPSFLFAVLAGYLSGIIYKIIHNFDLAFWFYLINFLMVLADLLIYFIKKTRQN